MGVGCVWGGLVQFILNAKMKELSKCSLALLVLVVLVQPSAGCQQQPCPTLPCPHPSPLHPLQLVVAVKRCASTSQWGGVAATIALCHHHLLLPLLAALLPHSVANAPGEQHRVLLACPSQGTAEWRPCKGPLAELLSR